MAEATDVDRVAGTRDADPAAAARVAHRAFLDLVEPHRPALWRYCRSLCRTPWDAEDLLQESLSRAYAKLPLLWQAVDLASYLRGVVRNCWSGLVRARREVPEASPIEAAEASGTPEPDMVALWTTLNQILSDLSPRQGAILLFKALGFSSAEIADKLAMSSGAVRTETSRARARLLQGQDGRASGPAPVLDAFVRAFNAHDLQMMEALLSEHARAVIVGVAEEHGRSTILQNSIADDLANIGARASLHELYGEMVVAVTDGGTLTHLMRVTAAGGGIDEIRTYYFCPEVLDEVAAALDRPVRTTGYYFAGE